MLHVPRSSYYYQPQHSPEQQRKAFLRNSPDNGRTPPKGLHGQSQARSSSAQGNGLAYGLSTTALIHIETSSGAQGLSLSLTRFEDRPFEPGLDDRQCRAFVIAIIDLYSRKNLAYNVVNTMDAYSCIETLLLAMTRYGIPEIFNSDQGSQFTSKEFTDVLKEYGVKISMDGRGRCHDNAKMERFWWSLKYEDLLIKEYKSLPQLRRGVQGYVNFYNGVRLHSALNYRTPDAVYEEGLHNRAALLLQKKKTNTCNQNKEDVY